MKRYKGKLLEPIKAQFELLALQATSAQFDEIDFITKLTNLGLLQEIITRLQELSNVVMKSANNIINIGKIILMKLMEFIKENPGMALGLAIGICLAPLASSIPFIGNYLAPIIALTGIYKGFKSEIRLKEIYNDWIIIAKKFWALFVDILSAVIESGGE